MPSRVILTDHQIMLIRSDYAAGLSQYAISVKHGLSKSVVRRYVEDIGARPAQPLQMVFKCTGCPQLFYSRKNPRRYCSTDCRAKHCERQKRERLDEFFWIAGTDTWENIARRLGLGGVSSLARFLNRCGELEWAARVERVDLPTPRVWAA